VEDLSRLLLPEGVPGPPLPAGQVAEHPPGDLLAPGEEHEGGEEAVAAEGGHEPGDAGCRNRPLGSSEEEGPEVHEGLAQGLGPGAFPLGKGLEEGLVAGKSSRGSQGAFQADLKPQVPHLSRGEVEGEPLQGPGRKDLYPELHPVRGSVGKPPVPPRGRGPAPGLEEVLKASFHLQPEPDLQGLTAEVVKGERLPYPAPLHLEAPAEVELPVRPLEAGPVLDQAVGSGGAAFQKGEPLREEKAVAGEETGVVAVEALRPFLGEAPGFRTR